MNHQKMSDLIKVKITNPLDDLFNIGPTEIEEDDEYVAMNEGDLESLRSNSTLQNIPSEKDEEDIQIDNNIDTIYDAAISAFTTQTEYTEIIEPRYAARNAEVAAGYLNIALAAMAQKAKIKGDRKKQAQFIPFSNNARPDGTVISSREAIMKLINVDAEIKKI